MQQSSKTKPELTYNGVAAWLEGTSTIAKLENNPQLQEQLRLLDRAAESLRKARHEAGALSFQTSEMNPVVSSEGVVLDLETRSQNRAGLLYRRFDDCFEPGGCQIPR